MNVSLLFSTLTGFKLFGNEVTVQTRDFARTVKSLLTASDRQPLQNVCATKVTHYMQDDRTEVFRGSTDYIQRNLY